MKLEEILPHIVRFIIQERDARKDREPSEEYETTSAEQSGGGIGAFTDEQLQSAGWTPEQIAAHRLR